MAPWLISGNLQTAPSVLLVPRYSQLPTDRSAANNLKILKLHKHIWQVRDLQHVQLCTRAYTLEPVTSQFVVDSDCLYR